jgi:hypothetical protein
LVVHGEVCDKAGELAQGAKASSPFRIWQKLGFSLGFIVSQCRDNELGELSIPNSSFFFEEGLA